MILVSSFRPVYPRGIDDREFAMRDGANSLARRVLMILAAAPYALSWAELRHVAFEQDRHGTRLGFDDRDLLDAAEALREAGLVATRRDLWAISADAPAATHWAEVAGDAAFGAARLRRDVPDGIGVALAAAGSPTKSGLADVAWRMLVVAHRENTREDGSALLRLLCSIPEEEPAPLSRPARFAKRLGLLPPGVAEDQLAKRRARLKRLFNEIGSPLGV